jgi:uncharacterized protein (DUF2236 family)
MSGTSKAAATMPLPDEHVAFFPEDAAIRRVHNEAVVLLGGGRALLMQVAHPKVAAGVAEHSSFRDGKRQRLLRTLKPTLAIVFGTRAQAREATAAINAVHSRVVGPGYSAGDPELLFWVLATLIDTALLMHARCLGPLSDRDVEAYYQDMLTAGELLGVRRDRAPADIAAFRAYMESSLPQLEVTDEARAIAAGLFAGRGLAMVGGWALREMTAALLPSDLAQAYGMSESASRSAVTRWVGLASRVVLPHVPLPLRRTPGFLLPRAPGR